MKGFIAVDRLNDIQFIDTDKEFARHINEQAKESGLLPPTYKDMYTVDPNIVMQQFSPLIMSQWFLIDHAHNPCTSITCENNFLFVFKHFEDLLLIAINGDGSESEDFLTRKTLVFRRLAEFFFGPAAEEIGKPKYVTRTERWAYLRLLISTWTYLAKNEQSFLVEAVEKLHLNQVVNEQCIEVLQAVVSRVQEAGEKSTQHALLLVNSKLLSLYSNRNAHDLQSADILCIILLVRSLFPTHEKLEDLFAQTYRQKDGQTLRMEARSPATVKVPGIHRERYESAAEGFTTGDETETEDQYFSARESNKHNSSSSDKLDGATTPDKSFDTGNKRQEETFYPEVSERFFTPTMSPTSLRYGERGPDYVMPQSLDDVFEEESVKYDFLRPRSHTASEIEGHTGVKRVNAPEESMGRVRSCSLNEDRKTETTLCSGKSHSETNLQSGPSELDPSESVPLQDTDYIRQAVFLSTPICKFSPYQIYCQRIYPGIVLVVLSETSKTTQASRLVQLLDILKDLMAGRKDMVSRSQGQRIYDVIHSQLSKVLTSMKRAKGTLERLCMDVRKKWDNEEMRNGVMNYLEHGSHTEMSASLENSLKTLHNKLREIFLTLYLSPRTTTVAMTTALTSATELFIKQLGDYKDYLTVKAQRNITMTSYIEEFPGLVHFIYVNRHSNQIMAPALNITHSDDDRESMDATQLLKDKIWVMTEWMFKKLHEGYTSTTAREGDYHFSYFMWFENHAGEPELIQRPFRADCTAPPPGILTGNFYSYITHKCFPNALQSSVRCNELIMMHVGLANTQYIAAHCRQLAAKLYETSGDILNSISLL